LRRSRATATVCLMLLAATAADRLVAGVLTESGREALAAAEAAEMVDAIIVMEERTDAALAKAMPREVGSRLRALAARSQRPLLAALDDLQRRGEVGRVTRLPIINGVALSGTRRAILEISTRPDVGYICADTKYRLPPIVPARGPVRAQASAVDWNISAIKADAAWTDFGLRGEGMVVGNIDTGVNAAHPCLVPNYRGGTNSWFDPIGGSPGPYDVYGHGTATISGAVGNDPAAAFYGVAPNAQFIVAKGYGDDGSSSASDLLACAAWMLDPDGDPATADMPDAVNNSWGAGQADPWFVLAIEAWHAAGIYPVFAAGNDGPDPGTIVTPADYLNVLAVGATTSSNVIANWSSRGPATWNGVDYLKPDLVAPGSGVRVARASGGYIPSVGGTSFACPHVSGAAALIFQKQPALSHGDVMILLENTAVDLGPSGPDCDYGYGLLDVHAALAGVPNLPPQLAFIGTTGYEADGVRPDVGDPRSTGFRFGVRYSDPDGDPPTTIGVRIERNGTTVRVLDLTTPVSSPDYRSGVRFHVRARLSPGHYRYRFFARGGGQKAIGEAAGWQIGPAVRCPPRLDWTGGVGYETDGCEPEIGAALSTLFEFRVKVSDTEGVAPHYVKVALRRDGEPWKELDMSPRSGGSDRAGRVYKRRARLPVGRYAYRFSAEDDDGMAVGPATQWQRWLFVWPAPPAPFHVAAMATPTCAGTEITVRLSAPGALTCRILNVAGRPVRTICLSRDCAAGIHRLPWDLRDASGLPVPGGAYLVEAVARDPSGAKARALSACPVTRR
jgi:hypothetical protein